MGCSGTWGGSVFGETVSHLPVPPRKEGTVLWLSAFDLIGLELTPALAGCVDAKGQGRSLC